MAHGEYKTVGGKLVIVDFDVVEGRLLNVAISGDFFLEPPEALGAINTALEGLPSESAESELVAAIHHALGENTAMIGFSPAAIAIAVRRALDG